MATAERRCDRSDLPCWLCPHCKEFGQLHAMQKLVQPTPPEPPRKIAGWWSIVHIGGGRGYSREWVAAHNGDNIETIVCPDSHAGDDPLCHFCVDQLRRLLDDTPALVHDLEVAITRDHQFVQHGAYTEPAKPTVELVKEPEDESTAAADRDAAGDGGTEPAAEDAATVPASAQADDDDTGDTTPLPWGDAASRALRRLTRALQAIADTCKITPGPGRGWTPLVTAIRDQLGRIARFDEAPSLAHRYSKAVAAAHHAIDRPADLWCYGPCPTCTQTIYADRVTDPDDILTCGHGTCTYTATLATHQSRVLDQSADKLLTVAELVSAITWAGLTITRDQINGWIRRGRLTKHTVNRARWNNGVLEANEQTTYQLGAALELALDANKRKDRTA